MESLLQKAVQAVQSAEVSACKFITANDAGVTGAHMSGFHLHKETWPLYFDSAGVKHSNKDFYARIRWQDDFETESRFIYYGVGSRNEYRLTRFGKGFPFLDEQYVGDLLILAKRENGFYDGYVLSTDEDIETFLAEFNMSVNDVNGIIPKQFQLNAADALIQCFEQYLASLQISWPPTVDLAGRARQCYNAAFKITSAIVKQDPDSQILKWLDAEFQLFKTIENNRYQNRIQTPFASLQELITTANTILQRRKSRAGASLEHHLAEVFNTFEIQYTPQGVTEQNKKPDFIFPSIQAYHDKTFNADRLIMLACKTTCKDRWRQVVNEADKIKTKHLFTLQQGISSNQLKEMYSHGVSLVVPTDYRKLFPEDFQGKILTLSEFVEKVSA